MRFLKFGIEGENEMNRWMLSNCGIERFQKIDVRAMRTNSVISPRAHRSRGGSTKQLADLRGEVISLVTFVCTRLGFFDVAIFRVKPADRPALGDSVACGSGMNV